MWEFNFLLTENNKIQRKSFFFLLRDIFILAITWGLIFSNPQNLYLQYVLGIILGVCFYLAHEWSHFLGAFLGKSRIAVAERLWSPFLFSFESESNSIRQFIMMTAGGFLATAVFLLLYFLFLPDTVWAKVAWNISLFLTFLTIFVEMPIAIWSLYKGEIFPVEIPLISENRILVLLKKSFSRALRK